MQVVDDSVALMFLLGLTYIVNVFLWIFFKSTLEERKVVTLSIRSLFSTNPYDIVTGKQIGRAHV